AAPSGRRAQWVRARRGNHRGRPVAGQPERHCAGGPGSGPRGGLGARGAPPAAGAGAGTHEVFPRGAKGVVELRKTPAGYQITLDGRRLEADAVEVAPNTYSILIEGQSHQIRVAPLPDGTLTVHTDLAEYQAEVSDPRSWRGRRHGAHEA